MSIFNRPTNEPITGGEYAEWKEKRNRELEDRLFEENVQMGIALIGVLISIGILVFLFVQVLP